MLLAIYPFWWMFTMPGRVRLWLNYYFPNNVNDAFASDRQRGNMTIVVFYSLRFWVFWAALLATVPGAITLGLYFTIKYDITQVGPAPVLLEHFYYVIRSYWIARASSAFDGNLLLMGVQYIHDAVTTFNALVQ